jgi:DNA-binding response OmpR family regulator
VLLDLAMPGLDGFGVARRLRLHPRTRGIHIHCLTGLSDLDARARARLAGCEEFLTKPVDAARLLDVVRRQVEPPAVGWLAGLSAAEAREALAALEREGCDGLGLACEGRSFSIRCACPPGRRLGRDSCGRVRLVPW